MRMVKIHKCMSEEWDAEVGTRRFSMLRESCALASSVSGSKQTRSSAYIDKKCERRERCWGE